MYRRIVALVVLSLLAIIAVAQKDQQTSGLPRLIRFGGTLKAADSTPRAGVVGVTFSLYAEQQNGTPLWSEVQNVQVDSDGHYTVLLGANSTDGVRAELFTTNEARWLGVQVEQDPEQPRVLLVSVPYALKAGDAETVGGHSVTDFVLTAVSNAPSGMSSGSSTGASPTAKGSTTAGAAPLAGTVGAGSLNAIAKYDVSGNLLGSNLVFDTGAALGIGTQSPTAALDVNSTTAPASGITPLAFRAINAITVGQINNLPQNNLSSVYSGTGTQGSIVGLMTNIQKTGIGSITNAYGVASSVQNWNATGTITNAYAFMAQQPVTTGPITNSYGFYAEDPNSSNYFAGKVGIGTSSPVFNLDVVGGIEAQSPQFPQINFKQTGASGFTPQEWRYQINPDGSYRIYDMTGGVIPRFVLTQAGNLGLGTSSPAFNLDVVGGIEAQSPQFPQINFKQTGGGGSVPQEWRYQINPDGSYRIYDMTGGVIPRFVLTQAGNVGIGTSFPNDKLVVNGTVNASGNVVATGFGVANPPSMPFSVDSMGNVIGQNISAHGDLSVDGRVGGFGSFEAHSGLVTNSISTFGGVPLTITTGNLQLGGGLTMTSGVLTAGSASINGTLSAQNLSVSGTKNFKIDHPLDPANKYLYHASIESSEVMNLYTGTAVLNKHGEAWVELPEWFEALNRDFRYQLTAVGAPGPKLYIAQEISGNHFKIAGGKRGMKVSWLVTGVRHDAYADAHRMRVEEEKTGSEAGTYLNPELFGQPASLGVRAKQVAKEQH